MMETKRLVLRHWGTAAPPPEARQQYLTQACRGGSEWLSNRSGQTSVSAFHTMLMLGGISTPVCDSTASVADFFYIPQQLYYLNDHNRPVKMPDWLEDALAWEGESLP